MTLQKILWFGTPLDAAASLNTENWHDYYVEHLPLDFSLDYLDLLGQFTAAIVRHKTTEQHSLRLLKNLRRLRPEAPLIVLAENPTKSEIIEAFRNGATDCVEEPIDLEGFFYHVKRLIQEKVAPKINKIYLVLNEIGKKITAALYNTQHCHFAPPVLFPKWNEETKARQSVMRVQFFGKFILTINGKEQPCKLTRREKSLLAYLLLHHHKPITRDKLIERFWSDTSSDCGRNSLHVAISGIRRWLESIDSAYSYISFQDNMYSCNPALVIESDVAFFQNYFQEAWHLEQQEQIEEALHAYHRAFGFYRDSFLAEFDQEDWINDERRRLEEKFIVVLKTLGEYFFKYNQFDFAIHLFEKILEIDDCYEQAHRGLMQSYHAKNMKGRAIRQYQHCATALAKELNAKPSGETTRLYQFICH
ncbi:MAG: BTAD domain-containing putative transcriptional regulator [Saprospiraceae bacterium]